MRFNPGLQIGDTLTFGQLRNLFQCSNAGGVLPTKKFQTLVIVSNHIKGIADDKWENDILYYTGMGMNGDQMLDGSHNKILSESNTNGMTVHLFEVYVQNEYVYRGIVRLVQEPYQEFRQDNNGNIRRVWVFPVKVVGDAKKEDELEEGRLFERIAEISDQEIETLEMSSEGKPMKKGKPIVRNGINLYLRNTKTALRALKMADFQCEFDESHWIGKRKGAQYALAKPRHLIPLRYAEEFSYSLDVVSNIVSLCPTCYESLCYGSRQKEMLEVLYRKRADSLKEAGIEITLERLLQMYE